jgi:hypothetical protein
MHTKNKVGKLNKLTLTPTQVTLIKSGYVYLVNES